MQAAVSEKLGLVSPQRLSPQRNHPLMMGSDIMAMSFDEEADPEFHRFSRFVENGIPFFKKYPIKTEINLEKKVIQSLFRMVGKNYVRIIHLVEI